MISVQSRKGEKSWLEREILEQPLVLSKIWSKKKALQRLAKEIAPLGLHQVVFVARGSSDHAAVYGKYLFELTLGVPVSLAAPSVVTRYKKTLQLKKTLVVALSQSGESEDVLEYVAAAGKNGAYTLAISNDAHSGLVQMCQQSLLLHAKRERSLAATKTYTAELFTLLILALSLRRLSLSPYASIPEKMGKVLRLRGDLEEMASRLSYAESLVVLGRGLNTPTAMEWGLKLVEVCGLQAMGMSAADFLHGPQALRKRHLPYALLMPSDPTLPFMRDLAGKLGAGNSFCFSDSPLEKIFWSSRLPKAPPLATPILYAVPGQLLALEIARQRGLAQDNPPFLQKVTRTL